MTVRIADDAVDSAVAFLVGVMRGTVISDGRGFFPRMSACTDLIRFWQTQERDLPLPADTTSQATRTAVDYASLSDAELDAKVAQIIDVSRVTTTSA